MNIFETISSAFNSVFSNKMRTFLTMIGIIIGVASVIIITSLGNGMKGTIEQNFEMLNAKALQIMPNWSSNDLTSKDVVTLNDSETIRGHSEVKYASAVVQGVGKVKLKNPSEEEFTSIVGTEVDFSYMQKNYFDLVYGRVYTQREDDIKAKVCVIDENLAFKIFGRRDVTGEIISLNLQGKDYDFEVVGVTKVLPTSFMMTQILMPAKTYLEILDKEEAGTLYIEVYDTDKMDIVKSELTRMIAANNNTTDRNYLALANLEQLDMIMDVIDIFTIFISFVAGLSLLVAGVGVMNIMLVTVTERTREIGIRKSIGATEFDIKLQFMIEAMLICSLGGVIGIGLGYVSSNVISSILRGIIEELTGMSALPPELSMPVAIGAMLISTVIGVVFGVYPASKASKLNPIEALRFE